MSSSNSLVVRRSRPVMGSLAEVFLVGGDEQQLSAVAEAALDEIERLSERWSRFSQASEISRINREASRGWVRIDRELFSVLVECDRWRQLTAGAFDITAGSSLASQSASLVDGRFKLDPSRCAIRFLHPGASLDLGGYGKGAALDLAAERILELGAGNALLQIGTSSVRALGTGPAGTGWPVGLRAPDCPDDVVREIVLQDVGLSCSATTATGQQESDLIDPRTGRPVTDLRACCVTAPTAAVAEALSTAAVVDGDNFTLPVGCSAAVLHWL